MISDIKELFERRIQWEEELPGGTQFFAYVEGDLCQLSMNDYPDEPMYTLMWRQFAIDLDDRPLEWSLPPMK